MEPALRACWRIAAGIAALVAVAPGCCRVYHERNLLSLEVDLPPVRVVSRPAGPVPRSMRKLADGRMLFKGSLEECSGLLPFTPVVMLPPQGFKLTSARVYRETYQGKTSVSLELEYVGRTADSRMLVRQPEVIALAHPVPRQGTVQIRNYADKPPAVGDPWTRILAMAVPGFGDELGVLVSLEGPATTRPPADAELIEMVRSVTALGAAEHQRSAG